MAISCAGLGVAARDGDHERPIEHLRPTRDVVQRSHPRRDVVVGCDAWRHLYAGNDARCLNMWAAGGDDGHGRGGRLGMSGAAIISGHPGAITVRSP